MTALVSKSISRQVELTVDASHLQVGDDLFAYQRKVAAAYIGAAGEGPNDLLNRSVTSGLIDSSQLSVLEAGNVPRNLKLQWMSPKVLELARTRGFNVALEDYSQPENTFVACQTDPSGQAVRVDWSAHMLFDRHDNPLPVAVIFDYISSGVDDGHYDLEGLAQHLMERGDVVVFSKNTKSSYITRQSKDEVLCGMAPKAKSVADAVFDIPHYNAETGREQSVQFAWMPTGADYQRVWDVIMQRRGSYPSTEVRRTVMDMNLLGTAEFALPEAPKHRKRKR